MNTDLRATRVENQTPKKLNLLPTMRKRLSQNLNKQNAPALREGPTLRRSQENKTHCYPVQYCLQIQYISVQKPQKRASLPTNGKDTILHQDNGTSHRETPFLGYSPIGIFNSCHDAWKGPTFKRWMRHQRSSCFLHSWKSALYVSAKTV